MNVLSHCIIHFQRLNFMVCELNFNKPLIKNQSHGEVYTLTEVGVRHKRQRPGKKGGQERLPKRNRKLSVIRFGLLFN